MLICTETNCCCLPLLNISIFEYGRFLNVQIEQLLFNLHFPLDKVLSDSQVSDISTSSRHYCLHEPID